MVDIFVFKVIFLWKKTWEILTSRIEFVVFNIDFKISADR